MMTDTRLKQCAIDLHKGWATTNLLPTRLLRDAATSALSDPTLLDEALGYGPNKGHLPLRENIARMLTDFYEPLGPINADRICITGGASQNLSCILQVFTDAAITNHIWMSEPAYFLSFQVFRDAGFHGRLRGVPEDERGMDAKFIEDELEKLSQHPTGSSSVIATATKGPQKYRKTYKHIFYCVPTFSNPSGVTMSLDRRQALLKLARKHDALIISDDVYDFLQWENPSIWKCIEPRFVDLDRETSDAAADGFGNAVSNATFSKLIGPGCRVGWAEGSERFIAGLSEAGSTQSGGAPSQAMSTIVNRLFDNDALIDHIKSVMIPVFAKRHAVLTRAIREQLVPLGLRFHTNSKAPKGGFCIWIQLPAQLSATVVTEVAKSHANLAIGAGPLFVVPGSGGSIIDASRMIRLCFCWSDEDQLREGIRRLGMIIRELQLPEQH